MGEEPLTHHLYQTKSIEQRTLDTLERIAATLDNINECLCAPREAPETTREPKRTPESPDAVKDPDGHVVGYTRKPKRK